MDALAAGLGWMLLAIVIAFVYGAVLYAAFWGVLYLPVLIARLLRRIVRGIRRRPSSTVSARGRRGP